MAIRQNFGGRRGGYNHRSRLSRIADVRCLILSGAILGQPALRNFGATSQRKK